MVWLHGNLDSEDQTRPGAGKSNLVTSHPHSLIRWAEIQSVTPLFVTSRSLDVVCVCV